jgi:hypothetical protein
MMIQLSLVQSSYNNFCFPSTLKKITNAMLFLKITVLRSLNRSLKVPLNIGGAGAVRRCGFDFGSGPDDSSFELNRQHTKKIKKIAQTPTVVYFPI